MHRIVIFSEGVVDNGEILYGKLYSGETEDVIVATAAADLKRLLIQEQFLGNQGEEWRQQEGWILVKNEDGTESWRFDTDKYTNNLGYGIIVDQFVQQCTSTTANAMLAYILSRKRFMFRSALYRFWVFTLAAPVALLPQFAIFRSMHLVQTFWVYIIPTLVSVFHVMVMKTYMEAIPDSLEESAQLDGAGYVKIFCSIVSPLCKPVYATIAFFIAVNQWNSWFDAMLYNRMLTKYTTLQYELMKYLTQNAVASSSSISTAESSAASSQIIGTYSYENRPTPKTLAAAISVVTIIPVIALYPFFQRYFVSSLTIRGIKD